jgi:hypothetical protein
MGRLSLAGLESLSGRGKGALRRLFTAIYAESNFQTESVPPSATTVWPVPQSFLPEQTGLRHVLSFALGSQAGYLQSRQVKVA